ncbi:MAG: DNA-directed RNA polymerase subunit K [Candidatus Altiarchaeum hamiconexum]|uniref:DNA-directed RNA polymerase subunit Rpo6 n=1 Tax=Candidatus Altarchaeum hamiconexum TaxID=1803513 RepID=A0A8J7YYN2_9ARCH|nr:DNA-directed RNA polymerase subunit K [Candidatus Altarchaeum hamiconexum]NCT01040.1 DNA-directed RNA polymerase subunit K [Candidatus Altarchaeum hamiconexum]PIX48649.1 MAG: DNA-directed RNA polymerase subunit K [Candidatus Altarchaeum sp. CG_4_8_14_3_um_filter_33_2054]
MDLAAYKNKYGLNKFELARILGARALQIRMGAPIFVEVLEDKFLRPFDIAKMEFENGTIPITVKRKNIK